MSNSFNEDYNTYLLEKSILETSKPPINNIETIENIEDKPEKSIEDTLLELENTNDLLQGGNNIMIGGSSLIYIVEGNYIIDSSASNGIFGLAITPNISGSSTIPPEYFTTGNIKDKINIDGTTITVKEEFYNTIDDNQQLNYEKIYTENDVSKTETATYYVSKISGDLNIKLRATQAGVDYIVITTNDTTSITLTNPNETSIRNKLQFIQICNNLKQGIYMDKNDSNQTNWSYIMKNYLVNLLEKIDTPSNIEPLVQISDIITAIKNSVINTDTTTYDIDLSRIKLNSNLNKKATELIVIN
jgi:hypothetical protein